jgi:hypothetical protein
MYVYLLSGVLCGLVVPAEVEEAVRLGELESVSLSRCQGYKTFYGRKLRIFIISLGLYYKTFYCRNCYAECNCAECRNVECNYAECRGALQLI